MLQHNKARYQPFWSDPLNPIFCLSLIFLAGTLRSLPVQVRLLLVLAAAPRGGGAWRAACRLWGRTESDPTEETQQQQQQQHTTASKGVYQFARAVTAKRQGPRGLNRETDCS